MDKTASGCAFTVSERCTGRWGASYFTHPNAAPSDQGVSEPSLELALQAVRGIALAYGLPYERIRTRTYAGEWGEAA